MTNKEWNSEISGNLEDKVIKNILFEFNKMFEKARPLKEVLERYQLETKLMRKRKLKLKSIHFNQIPCKNRLFLIQMS